MTQSQIDEISKAAIAEMGGNTPNGTPELDGGKWRIRFWRFGIGWQVYFNDREIANGYEREDASRQIAAQIAQALLQSDALFG